MPCKVALSRSGSGSGEARARSGDIPVAVVATAPEAHIHGKAAATTFARRKNLALRAFGDGDRNVAAPWVLLLPRRLLRVVFGPEFGDGAAGGGVAGDVFQRGMLARWFKTENLGRDNTRSRVHVPSMRIDELRTRQGARPFRAFTLRLNDGRTALVDHPELMIIPPDTDELVFVYEVPGGLRIIDVPSINEISFVSPKNGKAKPRRKPR